MNLNACHVKGLKYFCTNFHEQKSNRAQFWGKGTIN